MENNEIYANNEVTTNKTKLSSFDVLTIGVIGAAIGSVITKYKIAKTKKEIDKIKANAVAEYIANNEKH